MNNKEKFLALVSKEKTNTIAKNRDRIKNREMLRESQKIALKVLDKLEKIRWSQKKLAAEMGVSPQQITKIVKGQENLTLETQIKLQRVLDIPILASYYDDIVEQKSNSELVIKTTQPYTAPKSKFIQEDKILLNKKEIKMDYDIVTNQYNYFELIA
ncbi:helix-turn-helix domain-containing protein [Flavobacterium sp. ANB]|uniref:helix-turn-helix transcriptional regulator n=1 Tax=unclassified Flavobacterium TaxID=196869 RepID=UPI0012B7E846|nr:MULTISPECIES: helix-turn-helix domain-containing protein [unclassified Flavobacterium]MBF4515583.1 helix-turn-helix domain-containing protein [Flavobacterium sp. ANB]MTD68586.1 helix-turn-helix domain-containing protein [Flavobacterium sp. LC2016-13]